MTSLQWSGLHLGECCFTIGNFQGDVSLSDEFFALTWNDASHIAVVDLKSGVTVGQFSSAFFEERLSWVDVSSLGNYVVVGTSAGVFRYDLDFMKYLVLNSKSIGVAHADLVVDKNGNEVLVREGNDHDGDISYTMLESNTLHVLDVVSTRAFECIEYSSAAANISGQAHNVPGRILFSLQAASGFSSLFTVDLEPHQSWIRSWGYSFSTGSKIKQKRRQPLVSTGRWLSGLQTGCKVM